MKKGKQRNYGKHLLQWGVLLAIVGTILYRKLTDQAVDVEAYCPFGGLEALSTYLNSNTLACSMSMLQIMMGITLAVAVILFSKLFCGYLCPLGTLSEWMGKLGAKCHCNLTIASGSIADRLLRAIKYVLLFVIFYFTLDSSELFCKKFDPYYAMATGFKGEILPWLSAITVSVLFLGSFFVKMFWCRYICALGALSNVFKFTGFFVMLMVGAWGLSALGVAGAWVWVLGALCAGGYLLEALQRKSRIFPVLAIKRDASLCNGCGLCMKRCPYQLDLKNVEQVRNVDCTMCGECVTACATGALQVQGKRQLRWLPALLAILLFGTALYLGDKWELPTIDEKWGEELEEKMEAGELHTFKMSGLQSIKCFGSSKALSAKMQSVKGVYGVKTFVKSHSLEMLYDPEVITERQLQELLFTPTMRKYATPEVAEVQVLKLGVEGLHDRVDMTHFGLLFFQQEGIYGFTSQFDCPVRVELFVDPAKGFTEEQIRELVEVREYIFPNAKADFKPIEMHFDLITFEPERILPREEFVELMFDQTRKLGGDFTGNVAAYTDTEAYPRGIFEVAMPEIEKTPVKMGFPYLMSFLSTREGIASAHFVLRDLVPTLQLTYVKALWNDERIRQEILQAKTWTIRLSNGTQQEVEPRIQFVHAATGKSISE